MKKFEVKLTGKGNEPKVSIISPDGETVYENWAATETEARILVEALNRQVSAAPVPAVSVAGETVELPMTVAPVLTPEEDKELVHAASVVCMTRFDRRYRVRAGLTESQYRRAAEMLIAELSRAICVPLPVCADEIIPLLVGEFSKSAYGYSYCGRQNLADDPLYDFKEMYLTEIPYSFEDAFPMLSRNKPEPPTAWLDFE